mmetsp:Transcript_12797/g.34898  ORF Transcript_12797/g.34898 Transcript_12797/m.34898 type:complete len:230 (+) Transcript_12797:404-1093(+)
MTLAICKEERTALLGLLSATLSLRLVSSIQLWSLLLLRSLLCLGSQLLFLLLLGPHPESEAHKHGANSKDGSFPAEPVFFLLLLHPLLLGLSGTLFPKHRSSHVIRFRVEVAPCSKVLQLLQRPWLMQSPWVHIHHLVSKQHCTWRLDLRELPSQRSALLLIQEHLPNYEILFFIHGQLHPEGIDLSRSGMSLVIEQHKPDPPCLSCASLGGLLKVVLVQDQHLPWDLG